MADLFTALRPLIHRLPPEVAHDLGLRWLRSGLAGRYRHHHDALKCDAMGLRFNSPVGLAAGFDKNAVAIDGLLAQGFGFVETGTVTPKAQSGNPKPRVFRLSEDEAVINRLGFNNRGLAPYVKHLRMRDRTRGITGANIGKNKMSEDAVADYVTGLNVVYPYADYITVNISSPNTQGLRDLQQKDALVQLLGALKAAREVCRQMHGRNVPIALKVAPDLDHKQREDIVEAVLAHQIDAIIVSNTTTQRPASLKSVHRHEQGGLSGKPLLAIADENLRAFYTLTGGNIPLIGVGGIASAEDAYRKIRSGATLVQLYTALVYQGFSLVGRINDGLAGLFARDGLSRVSDATGADVR